MSRKKARGVPAQPIRDHIATLKTYGMTLDDIADASGLPAPTLESILYRQGRAELQQTVIRDTARRLWAVQAPLWVTAAGARRRLQALAVAGWSMSAVSRLTGASAATLCYIRNGDVAASVRTRRVIGLAYRRLTTDAPFTPASARTRKHAEAMGWAPGLAWDSIDDPNDRPRGLIRKEAA